MRNLTKELQHSLDLASATSGDKVVTAQVTLAVTRTSFAAHILCCTIAKFVPILFLIFGFFFSGE